MRGEGRILYLADPLKAESNIRMNHGRTLVFDENGRYLSQAQGELWKLRQESGWICVAAGGAAAYIALALAAQLPVDRIALIGGWLHRRENLGRSLNRIRAYARRNLSLVVAEVLTFDATADELRFLCRELRHAPICAAEGDLDARLCLESWNAPAENNLPI